MAVSFQVKVMARTSHRTRCMRWRKAVVDRNVRRAIALHASQAQNRCMTVELTGRSEELIRKAIERGEYSSAEEMVGDALDSLGDLEGFDFVLTPEAEARIKIGMEQAERGECRDGREVLAELRAKLNLG